MPDTNNAALLTGDENKKTLLDLNAHLLLFKLLTHEEKTVRRNATMALGVIASHRKNLTKYCHVCLTWNQSYLNFMQLRPEKLCEGRKTLLRQQLIFSPRKVYL